ncbi:MAG: hypothetical protein PHD76_11990 [Methylacidiphilales bacterium]|nr:hypothetical protein [Candidatus Methylacidiphilales bacterium]
MLLNLNPYRVSINPSVLVSSAEEMLAHAGSVQSLRNYLNWDPEPEVLTTGFPAQKDARKLIQLVKDYKLRRQLKEKRLARGFEDFIEPRNGLKGWWQKKFCDPKELKLSGGHEILEFLRHSHRLMLLASLHDALLSHVSAAEPRIIEIEESSNYINPLMEMTAKSDMAAAERAVKALSAPLGKVEPDFLIYGVAGYVLGYDRKKSVAYYLA